MEFVPSRTGQSGGRMGFGPDRLSVSKGPPVTGSLNAGDGVFHGVAVVRAVVGTGEIVRGGPRFRYGEVTRWTMRMGF